VVDPVVVSTLTGAPIMAHGPAATSTVTLGGAASGLSGSGWNVFVGTDQGLSTLDAQSGATPVLFVPDEGDTTTAEGAVSAMAASTSGVVLSADAGLFHTQSWALLRSPLSDALADLTILDLAVGADDALWVVASDGLYLADADGLSSITFAGLETPRYVAAHGERALVSSPAAVHVVDSASWNVQTVEITGAIHDVASWEPGFLVAADDGLYEEMAGFWSRRTLSDGEAAQVVAIATEETRAVVATSVGLISITATGSQGLSEAMDLSDVEHLALDQHGNAWTTIGDLATFWQVGTPPSFEAEVKTYFAGKCNWCHGTGSEGAPKRDFTDYSVVVSMLEPIMERIALDLMPPIDKGLTTEEEDLLLARWIDGGLAP
jgi:ligand-binding sensor domain-containing protein